jgi:transposase
MKKIPVWIGLDYHQSHVQVCVVDQAGRVLGNGSAMNDWRAIQSRVGSAWAVKGVAIEACCGAADMADELIARLGWPVVLTHPGTAARMKRNPDKTDYSDARILADLMRVGYVDRVWLAPGEVRDLRLLTRYRDRLVRERRNGKLRVGAILRDQRVGGLRGRPWTREWLHSVETSAELSPQGRWVIGRHLERLGSLQREIHETELHLREVTRQDPLVKKLLAYKGIGLVTACVMRAELGQIDRFTSGKKLARFCGLTPRNASSGARQADAGLIRAANGALRTAIIEAAHRLSRFDPRWKALKQGLCGRGKPKSVAAAAVGNRWVRKLYHDLKSEPLAA